MNLSRLGMFALAGSLLIAPASAQFTQQAKLVGAGNTGASFQGVSSALSSDGNTLAVGGLSDHGGQGGIWIFTRSGGLWSLQQGPLVGTGTGTTATAHQGASVALSGDGNTVVWGGPNNGGIGAMWVWTRSGAVWSQQQGPVVGTAAVGANLGTSIALSGDGNTAIVGAPGDGVGVGAAWVFTRSGVTWTQQAKLTPSDATGAAGFGTGVGTSGTGNTAFVGGSQDSGLNGAAWAFTRSGATWTQAGLKLVGTGNLGIGNQGASVALSTAGNTAIVGAPADNTSVGAAWIYTLSGGVWSQQAKLIGSGVVGGPIQGDAVAISGNGNVVVIGGRFQDTTGASWVFARSGSTWTQLGSLLADPAGTGASQGDSVAMAGDGKTIAAGGNTDSGGVGATWVYGAPDMGVTLTRNGAFAPGNTGKNYTIRVTNSGNGPSSGTVTVTNNLPVNSLIATNMAGGGWTCPSSFPTNALVCTRNDSLGVGLSYPDIVLTVNVLNSASGYVSDGVTISGGGDTSPGNNTASDTFILPGLPDLTASVSHSGLFAAGASGATFTVKANNIGTAATSGTITVVTTLPGTMTITAAGGGGSSWTCLILTSPMTCRRITAISPNASSDALIVTVTVAGGATNTPANTISAVVSGGGETNTSNDTGTDTVKLATTSTSPDMILIMTHGNAASLFMQGQTGAKYYLAATNAGGGPTKGLVTVVVAALPTGLTATDISGNGWTCTLGTLTCTRSNVLAAGMAYRYITLTVDVSLTAPSTVTPTATVSGGSEVNTANDSASSPTTVKVHL